MIQSHPQTLYLLRQQTRCFLKAEHFSLAQSLSKQLIDLCPDSPEGYFLHAQASFALGEIREGLISADLAPISSAPPRFVDLPPTVEKVQHPQVKTTSDFFSQSMLPQKEVMDYQDFQHEFVAFDRSIQTDAFLGHAF